MSNKRSREKSDHFIHQWKDGTKIKCIEDLIVMYMC